MGSTSTHCNPVLGYRPCKTCQVIWSTDLPRRATEPHFGRAAEIRNSNYFCLLASIRCPFHKEIILKEPFFCVLLLICHLKAGLVWATDEPSGAFSRQERIPGDSNRTKFCFFCQKTCNNERRLWTHLAQSISLWQCYCTQTPFPDGYCTYATAKSYTSAMVRVLHPVLPGQESSLGITQTLHSLSLSGAKQTASQRAFSLCPQQHHSVTCQPAMPTGQEGELRISPLCYRLIGNEMAEQSSIH